MPGRPTDFGSLSLDSHVRKSCSSCESSGVVTRGFGFLKPLLKSRLIISEIQSTLVISTSVISNNRVSRTENLIPVLT